jgi:hypothetical protein
MRAAVSTCVVSALLRRSVGSTSSAIDVALGTNSRISSRRFAATSIVRKETPVRLPPGRLRLATKPNSTG